MFEENILDSHEQFAELLREHRRLQILISFDDHERDVQLWFSFIIAYLCFWTLSLGVVAFGVGEEIFVIQIIALFFAKQLFVDDLHLEVNPRISFLKLFLQFKWVFFLLQILFGLNAIVAKKNLLPRLKHLED